jgi:hypothetical protein
MLTKQEQRQLREIERGLHASDPRLVMLMSGGTYRKAPPARRRTTLVLLDALAFIMIVLAAATGALVLIFLSTLVTMFAMSLHVVRRRARTV